MDIPDSWALTPADLALIMAKNEANRVDFALLLLFYRAHGRFPDEPEEIEPGAVASIARQLGMEGVAHNGFNTADRTWKRHRAEIRALFGYREATVADAEMLSEWLCDQVATAGGVPEHLSALLNARCRELSIEPPSPTGANASCAPPSSLMTSGSAQAFSIASLLPCVPGWRRCCDQPGAKTRRSPKNLPEQHPLCFSSCAMIPAARASLVCKTIWASWK